MQFNTFSVDKHFTVNPLISANIIDTVANCSLALQVLSAVDYDALPDAVREQRGMIFALEPIIAALDAAVKLAATPESESVVQEVAQ